MSCSVPVLLLAFNRPEKTAKVLARIREMAPVRVYAHCDGPRGHVPEDQVKTAEVRQLIREQLAPFQLQTFFRTENAGIKNGIKGALDWFFEQEEYGIILEDDCLPDPSFFAFCEELLLRYRDDPKVMHIGGSNLAEASLDGRQGDYVFSHFSFIWGWASWRRAWQTPPSDFEGLAEFERNGDLKRYFPQPMIRAYMASKFWAVKTGKIVTWDYAYFYKILKNNGLCIVPKINLVQNIGVGEADATNTTGDNPLARKAAKSLHFPLKHPDKQSIDPVLEQAFFYCSQKSRPRLWLWYLLHQLGLR